MAKANKHQRWQRTQRRLKNQSFMEPSKRPLVSVRQTTPPTLPSYMRTCAH